MSLGHDLVSLAQEPTYWHRARCPARPGTLLWSSPISTCFVHQATRGILVRNPLWDTPTLAQPPASLSGPMRRIVAPWMAPGLRGSEAGRDGGPGLGEQVGPSPDKGKGPWRKVPAEEVERSPICLVSAFQDLWGTAEPAPWALGREGLTTWWGDSAIPEVCPVVTRWW